MDAANDNAAARLFERANQVAAQAMLYRREPNGAGLASLLRRDATALRKMARARLTA